MTSATSDAAATTGTHHTKHRRATTRGVSALMYASQQGDVNRVRKIIREQSATLLTRDRTGKTPLHYCCTSDNICAAQAADLLVMAAPDLVETHDEDGFTPLHLAVIAGNLPLVTFLLANKADVNAVDNEKHTVVHWATVCGETAALRAVLAAGAPVSTPDVHGGYPLHYAAQMCGGGGDKDSSLGLQVLQALLSHSDIVVSVQDGDGRQPLLWAASAGSAKAVLALVRAGAAVEAPDKDGLTALHCAASRGHTDCIDSLLTLCGASPDVIDSNGCTALHYAVTLGHADATALLLAHGADPNRQDRKGRSPAHCGCAKGQFETVKMIGAHGANLWLRNARGDLPLHEAAASGRRDLVKWLLDMRPSQVNARNNDGRCPLHLAALNDNADMCKILLDAGAQINPILRTSRNTFMTPLDCALQRGFRSTAKYLQLHGGIPANKLGDNRHGHINTGVNLQIKEDVTFWGDTSSDSERENGEKIRYSKRVQRKKLSSKYEKKRASYSGSDLENKLTSAKLESVRNKRKVGEKNQRARTGGRTDSSGSNIDHSKRSNRKTSPSRFEYTNEIVINGKTEINIHQTKQINIGEEELPNQSVSKISAETTETQTNEVCIEKDKRAKSAKHKVRDISGKVKENNVKLKQKLEKQNSTVEQPKESENEIIDEKVIVEAVEENNKAVEADTDKILKTDVNAEAQKILPDQQSNTSEEIEEHKSLVVEASVHEPPKPSAEELKTEEPHEVNNESKTVEEKATEDIDQENQPDVEAESTKNETESTTQDVNVVEKKESTETSQDLVNIQPTVNGKETALVEESAKIEIPEEKPTDETCVETEPTVEDTNKETVELEKSNGETEVKENQIQESEVTEQKEEELKETPAESQEPLQEMQEEQNVLNNKEKLVTEETISETNVIIDQSIHEQTSQEILNEMSEEQVDVNTIKEESKTDQEDNEEQKNTETGIEEETLNENHMVDVDKINEKEIQEETAEDIDQTDDHDKNEISETNHESVEQNEHNEQKERTNGEAINHLEEIKMKEAIETENIEHQEKPTKQKTKETETENIEHQEKPTKQKTKKIETENIEHQEKPTKQKTKKKNQRKKRQVEENGEQAYEIIYKTMGENDDKEDLTVEELSTDRDKKTKTQRRKEKLKPQKTVSESKSSEDEYSSGLESDSSTSTSATVKEHKSFRVLDDKEDEGIEFTETKSKKTSRKNKVLKKQRSRSEENKFLKDQVKEREKLKRSKIPTPLSKSHLSKSDKYLNVPDRKSKSSMESRVPSLPDINQSHDRLKEHPRSESNMSAPLLASISDNERGSASDVEEEPQRSSAVRKRKIKRRPKTRDARSAGSDYESSNVIDSGFEPSPRSSRIPKWKNMTERGVNMSSVTQSIQSNIRRYHLERKIFQHLLELKRMQIRAGQHNEAILVKRAIDSYHQSCASTVGAGRYVPEDYSFKSFEKFLYLSLRKLQRNGADHLKGLPETPANPLLCTQSTHRCMHATHAYTGIPCAAYLPKMDHHTIPKIGFTSTHCKPGTGFLPTINPKKAVTLELCHGNDKQVISLPADRLDQNKRYYVTFTVKGSENSPPNEEPTTLGGHRHSKSD